MRTYVLYSFGVRARALIAEIPEAYTKDYLSGLLIGTEIQDVLVPLISELPSHGTAEPVWF